MELAADKPSLLVFGPQTELPSQDVIHQLRQELIQTPQLSCLVDAIKNITDFWKVLVDFDPSLDHGSGAKSLNDLQQWIVEGGALPNHKVNSYLLAVTVILQITQYVRYLNQLNVTKPHSFLLKDIQVGGIQGFCVGFLGATAVATSGNEVEIAATAAVALRLAVCIGAYVDRNQLGRQSMKLGCVAIRWKEDEVSEKEIVDLIHTYPEVNFLDFPAGDRN